MTLVFVELKGGNDGLQMVCPSRDPLYRRLRPGLALGDDDVFAFDRGLALHRAMGPLSTAVAAGELAVVADVGYRQPNRSHFRSIQIWDHAADASELRDEGWLVRVLAAARASGRLPHDDLALDGVVFRGDDGPLEAGRTLHLAGTGLRPARRRAAAFPEAVAEADLGEAARHIERTRAAHAATTSALAAKLSSLTPPRATPLSPRLEGAVDLATRLSMLGAAGDHGVPVVKLTLPGFDTHTRQRPVQDRLLGELALALSSLRERLVAASAWQHTVVVVMSEFGRRVAENRNGGTDHGAAGPVLVLGGAVQGGLVGSPPRLDDLDDGDLKVRIHHRDVFASIARRAFGLDDLMLSTALSSTASLPLWRG